MILYISSNDGSDMRINKEVKTLSQKTSVIFIGIGDNKNNFLIEYCREYYLIRGSKKSIFTWLKFSALVWKTFFSKRIKSIHLINEELTFIFYPLTYFKHTVLDVFDSFFLRKNLPLFIKSTLMFLTYLPINTIIVTDKERKELMPTFLSKKLLILENFPNNISGIIPQKRKPNENLNIIFYGWLGMSRGGSFIKDILKYNFPIHIYMAGWFSDEGCKNLINDKRVTYWGILRQEEAIKKAAEFGDYLICIYEPINRNNIYASPNKIYDAIQIEKPVIINKEVKISKMVSELNIGYILPEYRPQNLSEIIHNLIKMKDKYIFPSTLSQKFVWENIEKRLYIAHRI